MVGAEGVPGEEAREVLDCAEGLVAADWVELAEVLSRRGMWRVGRRECVVRVDAGIAYGYLLVVATNFW